MKLTLPSTNATVMQNAQYFAHLSNAAYLGDPRQYARFDEFAFQDYDTFESEDGENFGIAARIDGALIVALRGTDDAGDWWSNLKFRQVADYDGAVHEGFYGAANSVWAEMVRLLGKMWQRGDTTWVAGHSLGGAMATLVARWLKYREYDIAGVHTFGQPRVGNNAYASKYPPGDQHYRFVNNKDFIPQVPYRWMGPKIYYEHVGKLYHFDKNGKLSRSDKKWNELVADFADDLQLRSPKEGKPDFGLAEHAIEKYIGRIEAALA